MENVSWVFAFTAGVLSFFSPCVFPLLPAYIANLTDAPIVDGKIDVKKRTVIIRSISFILGFSVIFVLMGASASFLGHLVNEYRLMIEKISGLLIVIFGLQTAGLLKLKFLMYEKRWEYKRNKRKNVVTSFIVGLAFGTGWTPCVGLTLSSILLLASSSDQVLTGMGLLWIYSLGLGIPFLIISLAISYSLQTVKNINKWIPKIAVAGGWLLVFMGILLFTGQLQRISSWIVSLTT